MAISGWTYGDTANTPTAAATYGEAVYTYYTSAGTDEAGNQLYTEFGESISSTTDAGTYYVLATVAADGDNYEELTSDYVAFVIEAKELSEEDLFVDSSDQTYTGSELALVSLSLSETTLATVDDYSVGYSDNIDVGTATATITGQNNYTGTVTYTFTIVQAEPTVIWPVDLSGETGSMLSTVSLDSYNSTDGTFAWADESSVIVYGTDTSYTMVYTPTNTNYKTVQQNVLVEGKDVTAPTAAITVGSSSWSSLQENITFDTFFNAEQTVMIIASDTEDGVAGIYYYAAEAGTDVSAIAESSWINVEESFTISEEGCYVIYVKVADMSGNTVYISTGGIVLDKTAPTISGLAETSIYCENVTFTVSDVCPEESTNQITVKIDGAEQSADSDGNYTVTADGSSHTVAATDSAGNSVSVTVATQDGHSWTGYQLDDTGVTIMEVCDYCNATGASVTISAPSDSLVYDGTSTHEATLEYSGTFADSTVSLTIVYTKDDETVTDTKAAGTYTASVTLGEQIASITYTVEKAEVEAPTITSATYTGEEQTASVTADETALYTVTTNEGGTDAGSYVVVLTLTDSSNYKWKVDETEEAEESADLTLTFTIEPKEVTLTWSSTTEFVYNGSYRYYNVYASVDGLVEKDESESLYANTELVTGDGVNVGTFIMKATSLYSYDDISVDNYKLPDNVTSPTYTITQASLNSDALVITVPSGAVYSGEAYSITVENNGTVVYYTKDDYTITYSREDGVADEYAQIYAGTVYYTITGVGNCTGTITGSFTIAQATPSYSDSLPTGLTGTAGETLSTVSLESFSSNVGAWSWSDEAAVMSADTQSYAAIFTPIDTVNYKTVEVNLTVTVSSSESETETESDSSSQAMLASVFELEDVTETETSEMETSETAETDTDMTAAADTAEAAENLTEAGTDDTGAYMEEETGTEALDDGAAVAEAANDDTESSDSSESLLSGATDSQESQEESSASTGTEEAQITASATATAEQPVSGEEASDTQEGSTLDTLAGAVDLLLIPVVLGELLLYVKKRKEKV